MSLNLIAREPDPSKRGSAVVCIPVVAYDDETVATVCGVLAHTATSVPILLIGAKPLLEALDSRLPEAPHAPVALALMRDGEAAAFNAAVQAAMPGDLVLVRTGVLVAEGWLKRLQAAAYSDTTVASATPLTLASAATELAPFDRRASLAGVASTVAERSLRLRPKIAAMGPKCLYIRRSALDLAATLQEEAGIEVGLEALTLELLELGMVHVLADDVVVEAGGGEVAVGGPPGGSPVASSGNEASVAATLGSDDHGSLRRALNHTRIALRRMSVTIDGRALSPAVGGTQTYVIALILGLARVTEIDLRVLVPSDLSERASRALASVPAVSTISIEEALGEPKQSDVVHRPQQVFTPDDMLLLRRLGLRLIVGQQDLIAYHNPSYHRDLDTWRAYRRTTRLALAGADQAIFFPSMLVRTR